MVRMVVACFDVVGQLADDGGLCGCVCGFVCVCVCSDDDTPILRQSALRVVTSTAPTPVQTAVRNAFARAAGKSATLLDASRLVKASLTAKYGSTWHVVLTTASETGCAAGTEPNMSVELVAGKLLREVRKKLSADAAAAAPAVDTSNADADPKLCRMYVFQSIPMASQTSGVAGTDKLLRQLRFVLFGMAMVLFLAYLYLNGRCDASCAEQEDMPSGVEGAVANAMNSFLDTDTPLDPAEFDGLEPIDEVESEFEPDEVTTGESGDAVEPTPLAAPCSAADIAKATTCRKKTRFAFYGMVLFICLGIFLRVVRSFQSRASQATRATAVRRQRAVATAGTTHAKTD